MNRFNYQQNQERQNYYRKPHHPHHLFTGIVTILLIMILALIGIGAYQTHSFPFNQASTTSTAPSSQSSSTSSNNNSNSSQPASKPKAKPQPRSHQSGTSFKVFRRRHQDKPRSVPNVNDKSKLKIIGIFWDRINTALGDNDGINTTMNTLFINGNQNKSYRGIKNWLRFVSRTNASNDTEVKSIVPYDARTVNQNGNLIVHYKVRYDFKFRTHSDHSYDKIQIYNWTAKFNRGHKQIQAMGCPRYPAKEYIK